MPPPVAQEAPACAQFTEKRLPVVIVVDRSDHRHREQYLAAIEQMEAAIVADAAAAAVMETAVIGFGPVEVLQSFRPVRHPGTTYLGWGELGPIGPVILRALDLVAERREQYRRLGIRVVYKPVVVLLTDKRLDLTDAVDRAGYEALRSQLDARRVSCWPIVPNGVSPQPLDVLASFRAQRCADTEDRWPWLLGRKWLVGSPPAPRPPITIPNLPPLPLSLDAGEAGPPNSEATDGGRKPGHA